MSAQELCDEIQRRRADKLSRSITPYPRNNPIASDLGPCAREQVLAITNWKDKPLFDVDVQARMDRGKLIEEFVLRELSELGMTVRVERRPFEMRDSKK